MTPFVIGVLAAGLWILVIVGVYYVQRRGPEKPEKSVRGFRRNRTKMAKVLPPAEGLSGSVTPIMESPDPAASRLVRALQAELGEEHMAQPEPAMLEVPAPEAPMHPAPDERTWAAEDPRETEPMQTVIPDVDFADPVGQRQREPSEEIELDRLISAISEDQPPKKRPKPKGPQRKEPPERGPRTKDDVTYFLIDDEGKPLL
jgi:hypothetical protein